MPIVDEDLIDGLRVTKVSGKLQLTRTFYCRDCEGATPLDKLMQAYVLTASGDAHTGANIPVEMDTLVSRGVTFYCKQLDVEPFASADSVVRAVYDTEGAPVAGFGPVVQESGSTLELSETKFDAANRALPFASRASIKVQPPTVYESFGPQFPSVPYFASKSTRIYTRQESSDPMPRSKLYTGKTNSTSWKGQVANTVLCLEIFGRNSGDGIWTTRYVFAMDDEGKFKQVAFWRHPDGYVPNVDFATGKGVTEAIVQGNENFNNLLL